MTDPPTPPPDQSKPAQDNPQPAASQGSPAQGVQQPPNPQQQRSRPPVPGGAFPGQLLFAQQQLWQGQYPPPDAVERYEQTLPGAFNRIIVMAEQLQAAQIEINENAVDYAHRDTVRGHWLGFVLATLGMAGSLGALVLGSPWVAGLFLALPVMSVAKALVDSVWARRK